MNLQTIARRCLLATFVAVPMIGCGDSSDTVTVHGMVSYRGQPLTDAALTFFAATGRPTTVAVDSSGAYSAELPPGEFDVIVGVSAQIPPGWKEGDRLPPPKVVLPAQYTTRAKTSLRAAIAPDQADPVDFDLN